MRIVWNPLSVNASGAMSSERKGLRTARKVIRPISRHHICALTYGSILEPSFPNDAGQMMGQGVKAHSFPLQHKKRSGAF
jgi:hypothetical protein